MFKLTSPIMHCIGYMHNNDSWKSERTRSESGEGISPLAKKVDKKSLSCNKPRKTPGHKTKSHVVKACSGGNEKIIRFGQQGVSGAGKNPKSKKDKARQKSFRARHGKNIAKGKMSAAYWANKVKW